MNQSENTPTTPSFADLTTIRIGGPIATFVEPTSEDDVIGIVREADASRIPLCVIGGGSNMLVSDDPFDGTVLRDARRGVTVSTAEATPSTAGAPASAVEVTAEAGANWDDFVAVCVASGFEGVEGLSGIPGTVGASVVQNIGAYGQEVATSVARVRVWDRELGRIAELGHDDLCFGYRSSSLKTTMYATNPDGERTTTRWFPTPRYIVLSVTYRLVRSTQGTVGVGQLAKALGVDLGTRMDLAAIREAVLRIRAAKDMLEDLSRYANPWMSSSKDVAADLRNAQPNHNRWSCGSFFINPVVDSDHAAQYLDGAPQYPGALPDGSQGVKTSAAWLIDHAGFHRGFALDGSHASLSTVHTLALTNRGGASFGEVRDLAQTIAQGVWKTYRIRLVPEPVVVR